MAQVAPGQEEEQAEQQEQPLSKNARKKLLKQQR